MSWESAHNTMVNPISCHDPIVGPQSTCLVLFQFQPSGYFGEILFRGLQCDGDGDGDGDDDGDGDGDGEDGEDGGDHHDDHIEFNPPPSWRRCRFTAG